MSKYRQHIAVLILGVFLSPILYQSIHIVWHQLHSYDTHKGQNCCATEKECFSTEKESFSVHEDICPICTYQFSTNNLPDFHVFEIFIPIVYKEFKNLDIQFHSSTSPSIKPSRAPPVMVFN